MEHKQSLNEIPTKPGIYLFKNQEGEILYVGKARNLKQRVKSYYLPSLPVGPKTQKLVSQIKKVNWVVVESEFEALLLEAAQIKKYQPKYNLRLKDDKSFLYIKITQEEFPRVYPARKIEGGYGPFPKAGVVRQILSMLRQIFPFRSCRKLPKKPCLYLDLGLCPAPCLGKIAKNDYRRAILAIKNLLDGKWKRLIKALKREMEKNAQENKFEKAAQIRDKMAKINWLGQSRHPAPSYIENPNLIEDLREEELKDLVRRLKAYLKEVKSPLRRIEAYDISNIAGQQATGSMVVFIDGEPDKASYRKFRIKFTRRPNDVAMIKEVLLRRLKHNDWDLPNLALVDGGKGQVSGVIEVLKKAQVKIPAVGLAKREETVIIPGKVTDKIKFITLNLPYNAPALNLLKRIRDEAHRFALAYHQRLRTNF